MNLPHCPQSDPDRPCGQQSERPGGGSRKQLSAEGRDRREMQDQGEDSAGTVSEGSTFTEDNGSAMRGAHGAPPGLSLATGSTPCGPLEPP